MRPIKFRAWDGERMYLWGFLGGAFIGPPSSNHANSMQMIQMEFTGLKDKKGKEIYEGDVVNAKCEDSPTLRSRYIDWVIRFQDGGFCAECPEDRVHLHYWTEAQLEVIGNIYESPELLK